MPDSLRKYSLLFVEDEDEIRTNYSEYLKRYFQKVYEAASGEIGYLYYQKYNPDIILLDINLPKINGLDLAKKIRESNKRVRIIIVTAYSDTSKLLKAIELQLTKYILKPISRRELKESLLKASIELEELKEYDNHKSLLNLGDNYFWDKDKLYLICNHQEIKLTKNELKLLKLLSSNKEKIFSNEDIFANVWEDNFDKEFSLDSIKTLIKGLRKKIPKNTIMNIYGEGYRLNPSIFDN